MTPSSLWRLSGLAAIVGGGLRVVSALEPWRASGEMTEIIYAVTDITLLFGLMGIYLAASARLGPLGLAAFVVAESGIASIVGPDTQVFGTDMYQLGVTVISLGLCALGVLMLVLKTGPRIAGLCWIASTAVGAGGPMLGQAEAGFFVGGILFGVGFVVAGAGIVMGR